MQFDGADSITDDKEFSSIQSSDFSSSDDEDKVNESTKKDGNDGVLTKTKTSKLN